METIIRGCVPQYMRKQINEIQREASEVMRMLYPEVNFTDVTIIFSKSARRSRYYREGKWDIDRKLVTISMRDTIYLYDMKSLKMSNTSVKTGFKTQTVSALIHELTHHVQYEKGLNTGELLTTKNQLDHLEVYHPEIYNQFFNLKLAS